MPVHTRRSKLQEQQQQQSNVPLDLEFKHQAETSATLPEDENFGLANDDKLFNNATTRSNDTHIFFWGGVLSNWYTGTSFPGSQCLELLLPELEILGINKDQHPPLDAFSTRLLHDHTFNCGEQWMMATKAWFSERDLILDLDLDLNLSDQTVTHDAAAEMQFQRLKADMYLPKPRREWTGDSPEKKTWESALCKILRSKTPRQQKAFGRQARGFDAALWSTVNMACVVAACVARAEADDSPKGLRSMYLACRGRRFVEGSPRDVIWGVGIHWSKPEIEDPELWAGENRLGVCHDQAAVRVVEHFERKSERPGVKANLAMRK